MGSAGTQACRGRGQDARSIAAIWRDGFAVPVLSYSSTGTVNRVGYASLQTPEARDPWTIGWTTRCAPFAPAMNSGEPCPRDRQIGRGSRPGWRQSTTRSSASSSGRTAGIRAASSRQVRSCGRRCGTSGEVSAQRPSWTCPEPDRPARSDQRLAIARPASRRGTIRASAQAIRSAALLAEERSGPDRARRTWRPPANPHIRPWMPPRPARQGQIVSC